MRDLWEAVISLHKYLARFLIVLKVAMEAEDLIF